MYTERTPQLSYTRAIAIHTQRAGFPMHGFFFAIMGQTDRRRTPDRRFRLSATDAAGVKTQLSAVAFSQPSASRVQRAVNNGGRSV